MALSVHVTLVYGPSDETDPVTIANQAAKLLRQPVHHISTMMANEEPGLAEPAIEVDGTSVTVTLEVASSRNGTLQRLQWVVAELHARLMRETPADRPDLVTNPVSISVGILPR
jgi:hypothetical protein